MTPYDDEGHTEYGLLLVLKDGKKIRLPSQGEGARYLADCIAKITAAKVVKETEPE